MFITFRTFSHPMLDFFLITANVDQKHNNKYSVAFKDIIHYTQKEASESKMLDNRNDGIPLSGGLRDPQPEIKVGHIDKGADLIFGIPTVKVV